MSTRAPQPSARPQETQRGNEIRSTARGLRRSVAARDHHLLPAAAHLRTSLRASDLPDDLGRLRARIERAVPVGFHGHAEPVDVTRLRPVQGSRNIGNPASYWSASHGAGRRMSRNAARKRFTVADLVAQTAGVEARKDAGVVDEIPAAYKDIDQVIAAQADLVEVVEHLRQVVCVKG